jgi:hypothetical protein
MREGAAVAAAQTCCQARTLGRLVARALFKLVLPERHQEPIKEISQKESCGEVARLTVIDQ